MLRLLEGDGSWRVMLQYLGCWYTTHGHQQRIDLAPLFMRQRIQIPVGALATISYLLADRDLTVGIEVASEQIGSLLQAPAIKPNQALMQLLNSRELSRTELVAHGSHLETCGIDPSQLASDRILRPYPITLARSETKKL